MQAIVGGNFEAARIVRRLGIRLLVDPVGRQRRHRRVMTSIVIAAEIERFLDRRQGRSRRILSL